MLKGPIKVVVPILIMFFLFSNNLSAAISHSFALDNESEITVMEVSPDSSRYAVGTYDTTVIVFDKNNEVIDIFETGNVITDLTFLDNNTILFTSDDRNMYAYDSEGNEIFNKSFPVAPKNIASSNNGEIIITNTASSNIVEVMNENGEDVATIDIGFYIETLNISDNGEWIVVAGADQILRVFNSDLEPVRDIPLGSVINDVEIDNDGNVVVGTDSSTIEGFDESGNAIFTFSTDWRVTSIDLSDDGMYVAGADLNGYFYILDEEGSQIWRMHGDKIARSVAFSKDNQSLLTGTETGDIQILNISSIIKESEKEQTIRTIWTGVLIALGVGVAFFIGWYLVRRKKRLLKEIWKAKYIYLALLPSVLLIGVFLYYPAITGLVYSFFEWNPGSESHFIGFDNYKRMFQDQYVIEGLKNLSLLMITGIIKFMIPPLIVAELLFWLRNRVAAYWFRTIFVSSMVLPAVANILIWQNIYSGQSGLLNEFLKLIGLGNMAQAWLANPDTALWAIIFIGFPFISILHLLVYYAGLLSISSELKDAAMIDGASNFRIIRSIHLPLLKGQFKLLIVMTIIMLIQDFNPMLIITGGGPGTSTYVPALQMYYAATKFSEMGYASAIGVLLFIMIFIITLINLKFVKSEE